MALRLQKVSKPKLNHIVRLLPLLLILGACSPAIKYGKVAHSRLAAGEGCNPTDTVSDYATKPLFAVTSRLPDCTKAGTVSLTAHRAEKLRYARFAAPSMKAKQVDMAIQAETAWWDALEASARKSNGRILLYLHGYRETPLSVARDTGRIAALSKFEGPVIQWGWPAQGKLFSYLVDVTNMEADQQRFNSFLLLLASKPWANDIVIMTHSLSVKMVVPAVEKVDAERADKHNPIRNLIFASPDMDRQTFEKQAARGILSAQQIRDGRHVTIYASLADKALGISRHMHGYPRLGHPFCLDPAEAVGQGKKPRCYVTRFYDAQSGKDGLTLVDLTDLRHRRTAHSDFLLTAPGCKDLVAAISGKRGADGARIATNKPHAFTLARQSSDDAKTDETVCLLK